MVVQLGKRCNQRVLTHFRIYRSQRYFQMFQISIGSTVRPLMRIVEERSTKVAIAFNFFQGGKKQGFTYFKTSLKYE